LRSEDDYEKKPKYWKYLKAKLKRENNQVGSVTTQFKFMVPDGKKRFSKGKNAKGSKEVIERVSLSSGRFG